MSNFMSDKCKGSRAEYDPKIHGVKDAQGKITCIKCGRKLSISSQWSETPSLPVHVPREPRRTGGGSLRLIRRTE